MTSDRNFENETQAGEGAAEGQAVMEQFDIRHLSPEQFQRLGVAQIAYVKPVVVNGAPAFAIHAADGTPIALAENAALAFAAIVQNEMVPTIVQ